MMRSTPACGAGTLGPPRGPKLPSERPPRLRDSGMPASAPGASAGVDAPERAESTSRALGPGWRDPEKRAGLFWRGSAPAGEPTGRVDHLEGPCGGASARRLGGGLAVQVPRVVEPGAREQQVGTGHGGDGGRDDDPDFHANAGEALLTVRSEIPGLFEHDLTYDIYREDIVFRDPRNSFQGIRNYKILFWSLRLHGKIFFSKIGVEVKSVCQVSEREIRMRWCVHGVPRIPWEAEGLFDGISIYRLDRHGKIYEHEVSNVIFRDPPVFRFPWFAGISLAPQGSRQPCPGAWSLGLLHLIQRFSWVRMYLSLMMSMQLRNASTLAGSSS